MFSVIMEGTLSDEGGLYTVHGGTAFRAGGAFCAGNGREKKNAQAFCLSVFDAYLTINN
jgi:hypothetical protein